VLLPCVHLHTTNTQTWMAILCLRVMHLHANTQQTHSKHTDLDGNLVFENNADVSVRIEGAEGAKLRVLQEQHGLGSQAHRHHGDDVGVLQLV